jgi:lysozyme
MPEDLSAHWSGSVPVAATIVVKRIESFSPTPYPDNPGNPHNTWTIGYGSIVDQQGQPITPHTPPVTEDEATQLLLRDMAAAAAAVQGWVHVSLVVHEAAALISWTYNLGADSLRTSTMLADLNNGNKAAVPGQMRRWHYQASEPLLGLLRRRWAEAGIFVGMDPSDAVTRAWAEVTTLDDWPAFDIQPTNGSMS